MARQKVGVIFAYDFAMNYLRPMLEMELLTREDALSRFVSQSLLVEDAKKSLKEEAEVLAETDKPSEEKLTFEKGEKGEAKTYSLTYYNPETHKAEVIQEKIDIRIIDYTTRMIEESMGVNSFLPLYTFVAAPLIRKEVVPWILEDILKEREYGTPPEFGGGMAIRATKISEAEKAKKGEIRALKKQEEAARDAVAEAIIRKEESEKKLGNEIAVFEDVVKAVNRGEGLAGALGRLPPLSRARYLMAVKKKKLSAKTIVGLLLQDTRLLKSIKKKLETLTIDELLSLVKEIKKIRKKD